MRPLDLNDDLSPEQIQLGNEAHGGSEVKTMGDGFMASISSATKALVCAIAGRGRAARL